MSKHQRQEYQEDPTSRYLNLAGMTVERTEYSQLGYQFSVVGCPIPVNRWSVYQLHLLTNRELENSVLKTETRELITEDMTSFIISAKDQTKQQELLSDLLQPYNIDPLDQIRIKREVDEKTDKMKQSLGIQDVKRMQQKLFLKPLKSKTKAVIVSEAELLTTEAQNALLKILEEPPAQTIIVLLTTSIETLLPTIRSRCSIITSNEENQTITTEEKATLVSELQNITGWGIGKSLNTAEKLGKDKEQAKLWLQHAIILARELMFTDDLLAYSSMIKHLQQAHTTLTTTNANSRLVLESLFLSLQNIK